jgi:hypothetical protein
MNHEFLNDSQKKKARTMLEFIASAMRQPMPQATISQEVREALKRYWHDGTETQIQYDIILAVYNRFKGIKTPEETTQGISDWVKKGRQANGLD